MPRAPQALSCLTTDCADGAEPIRGHPWNPRFH